MYKCSECGGSFERGHFCTGKRHEATIKSYTLPSRHYGYNPYRVCSKCGQSYRDEEGHNCPMQIPNHVEKTVDRPLKEMLQELIDLMKQRPLFIQVPYQPIDLTITC